jgi:hypothetical protein
MKGQGLSRESRLLIDAARAGDDPSAADRKRVRAALARKIAVGAAAGAVAATATHAAAGGVAAAGAGGAAASTGVASGGATAASLAGGAIASGFGAKLFVSVAIVGAMSAGTVGYVHHEASKRADARAVAAVPGTVTTPSARSTSVRSVPVTPAPVTPAPVTREDQLPSVPVPGSLSPAPLDLAVQRSAPFAKPASTASSPTPAAPSDLDVELALLQDAHGALQMNDGARALRLLDEHARRFPNGALAEESEAARVFALREVGRADEARDVAARFLREHPRSPLAPRVTRAFDADAPTF